MPKEKSIQKATSKSKPSEVENILSCLLTEVKQMKIKEPTSTKPVGVKPIKPVAGSAPIPELELELDEVTFPYELEDLPDYTNNDDHEDILSKFVHDPKNEYSDVVRYHELLQKCLAFVTKSSTLKMDEKQRNLFNRLVNKLYEKMIIYLHNIELNSVHPIYEDADEKIKELILKTKRSLQRVFDSSYAMRKRFSYRKTELIPLLNNAIRLFETIVEIISNCQEEPSEITENDNISKIEIN